MANILENAVDILIDQSGNVNYLQETKLWEYDNADTTVVGASLTFNNSDLGSPDADKLINSVDADYEGSFVLSFFLDGINIYNMTFLDKSSRGTAWQDYPLRYRRPFQKIKLYITSTTPDTKIYGLEVDFNILRRRRYN